MYHIHIVPSENNHDFSNLQTTPRMFDTNLIMAHFSWILTRTCRPITVNYKPEELGGGSVEEATL